MKKKAITTSYFLKNNVGGILLPVLAILVMFTCLLFAVTENHFAKKIFLTNTKDFYLARTLEELSLMEAESDGRVKKQVYQYNIGTVTVTWLESEKKYEVETRLNNNYKRIEKRETIQKR